MTQETSTRGNRKERKGIVVGDQMDKTIVVQVEPWVVAAECSAQLVDVKRTQLPIPVEIGQGCVARRSRPGAALTTGESGTRRLRLPDRLRLVLAGRCPATGRQARHGRSRAVGLLPESRLLPVYAGPVRRSR